MTNSARSTNALALWRERQAIEKAWRVAELERLRAEATVEVHDGREFRVLRIPDMYDFGRKAGDERR